MAEWVNILCEALRETKVKQIHGNLALFDSEGELDGKCALGVISCEVGLTLVKGEDDPLYDTIMAVAGVPDEFNLNTTILPSMWRSGLEFNQIEVRDDIHQHLSANIFTLNDAGFTFDEIADWIETTFEDVE